MPIILLSPAKINLYLKITNRDEQTGMHSIDSLMAPINLFDCMKIEKSERFSVVTTGIAEKIPTEKNILFKAFNLFQEFVGRELPKFAITIEKSIPIGAGLGGGSGDAAFFIRFLNRYLKFGLTIGELAAIAEKIGSDVPFFLYDSPAVVSGRGEIVKPLKLKPLGKFLVLIYPEIVVNTGLAYELFDAQRPKIADLPDEKGGVPLFFNDFEETVFKRRPKIKETKDDLLRCGASSVFMSGSGSTLIALADSREIASKIEGDFSRKFKTVKEIKILY